MWVFLILFVLLSAVIVTGNVTVLVVFTRTPSLRKRKYFLLVSLAVADLFVGAISVPMFVTVSLLTYTRTLSTIYKIQDILFGTASVFGLTAVAIERAYAVYFPLKHSTLWKVVYMIGIAVVWLIAAFIAFSDLIFHHQLMFYAANVPTAVSLVIIIISYFIIWIKMSVQGNAINERGKRLTVTLLVVTVISLIAWTPFQALSAYVYFCRKGCHYSPYVVFGAKFLHYSNSLVNPIIYALRMPQFKTELLYRLRKCVACNSCYEEDHGNTANANRTNASEIDSDYDNDVVNHVSYEEDNGNSPDTISGKNVIDNGRDNDAVNDMNYEEDHGNRPDTNAIIGGNNVIDSGRDNDAFDDMSYEKDHGNRPNTITMTSGNNVIDDGRENDTINHVSYEEHHVNRHDTNSMIGGNNVNDSDYENSVRTRGNNDNGLELKNLENHDKDVNHSNVSCRGHEENIC